MTPHPSQSQQQEEREELDELDELEELEELDELEELEELEGLDELKEPDELDELAELGLLELWLLEDLDEPDEFLELDLPDDDECGLGPAELDGCTGPGGCGGVIHDDVPGDPDLHSDDCEHPGISGDSPRQYTLNNGFEPYTYMDQSHEPSSIW